MTYVTLGRRLVKEDFRVRLVSTRNHEALMRSNGIDFLSIEVSTEDTIPSEKMRVILETGKLIARANIY